MSIEIILGIGAVIIAAIAGAFGLGHSKGKSTAETKAAQDKAEAYSAAVKAAADRQTTVAKEAAHVDQSVNNLSNDDVDRELLKYTRKE